MSITGKQYADQIEKMSTVEPQPGYIWGTSGKLWTEADQKALIKKYKSDPVKYKDLKLGSELGHKWIGHIVYDCSGLTSKAGKILGLSYHHGSNSSWNSDCSHKGNMTSGLEIPVGAWVYTGTTTSKPHIGTYIGNGLVREAQGTRTGVVRSKLSASKWKFWGLGKGMEFDFIPKNATKETKKEAKKETKKETKVTIPVTIRRGARGENVKLLQTLLSKAGSKLVIDGIFGPGTQSAVRSFQSKNKLVVDGIVGPKTWTELLKLK